VTLVASDGPSDSGVGHSRLNVDLASTNLRLSHPTCDSGWRTTVLDMVRQTQPPPL
jgi:hypothetical protein